MDLLVVVILSGDDDCAALHFGMLRHMLKQINRMSNKILCRHRYVRWNSMVTASIDSL
jgi:hypothetical protein